MRPDDQETDKNQDKKDQNTWWETYGFKDAEEYAMDNFASWFQKEEDPETREKDPLKNKTYHRGKFEDSKEIAAFAKVFGEEEKLDDIVEGEISQVAEMNKELLDEPELNSSKKKEEKVLHQTIEEISVDAHMEDAVIEQPQRGRQQEAGEEEDELPLQYAQKEKKEDLSVTQFITKNFSTVKKEIKKVAVGYNQLFSSFDDGVYTTGGVHLKSWGGKLFLWPKTYHTMNFHRQSTYEENPLSVSEERFIYNFDYINCNTRDGLQVELELSIHFKPEIKHIKYLTRRYRTPERWRESVANQVHSSARHVCAVYTALEFQEQHNLFINQLEAEIIDDLDQDYRCEARKINIYTITRPVVFEDAIRRKENAKSEIVLALRERNQKLVQADTELQKSHIQVEKLRHAAEIDTRVVLAQAEKDAENVLHRVEQISFYLEKVKLANELNETETLQYMKSETLTNDVFIQVDFPSQITFRDEL
eukprot:maker-scaffold_16-snap-gene-0.43-mRNA-1 protein AED:0.15 eAED:0.45 QI:0/0/0.5/1/1/1/2/176/476